MTEQEYKNKREHDLLLEAQQEFAYFARRAEEARQKLLGLMNGAKVLSMELNLVYVKPALEEKKEELPVNGQAVT